MKSAKALSAIVVTFVVTLVEYLAPDLPKELVVTGGALLTGIAVYVIPNK